MVSVADCYTNLIAGKWKELYFWSVSNQKLFYLPRLLAKSEIISYFQNSEVQNRKAKPAIILILTKNTLKRTKQARNVWFFGKEKRIINPLLTPFPLVLTSAPR
eukprot:Lithocolla_globosa_v1_NODE_461_length_3991_cov_15.658283.p5 type:complete len:104 gc:universal NODE_461_length_3991_cov_15.658283:3409-3720(+)